MNILKDYQDIAKWLTGNSWLPSIKINGQLVSGVDGEGSAYVVAFDAK